MSCRRPPPRPKPRTPDPPGAQILLRKWLAALAVGVVLTGCVSSMHVVASAAVPMRVQRLQVVVETACQAPAGILCQGDTHVEREIRLAVEQVLVPRLREAGIDAALAAQARAGDAPVLTVHIVAVHHHHAFVNGSAVTAPYVDLSASLQQAPEMPNLWHCDLSETWPGMYIDVQPRYDALVRKLAAAAVDAVVAEPASVRVSNQRS